MNFLQSIASISKRPLSQVAGITLDRSSQRYERKFLIEDLDQWETAEIIKHHSAAFSEVFVPRVVNNIYLDTTSLENYWDNVCGSQKRLKVRIRWYGPTLGKIPATTLEIKIRDGFTGWKALFPLGAITLDTNFRASSLRLLFQNGDLPPDLMLNLLGLEPTLLNSYRRRYFISFDKKYRLTIDTRMKYSRLDPGANLFLETVRDGGKIVVELKYSPAVDKGAAEVTGLFPFRLTKSSKYVTGVALLNQERN